MDVIVFVVLAVLTVTIWMLIRKFIFTAWENKNIAIIAKDAAIATFVLCIFFIFYFAVVTIPLSKDFIDSKNYYHYFFLPW